MKKIFAAALACSMLAACGTTTQQSSSSMNTDNTSALSGVSNVNAAVFYYDYADNYISSVRSAMDTRLNNAGIKFQNYDAAGNQATQSDGIATALAGGANLLIVNVVENASPDAAQKAVDAAKTAGIPVIFFNRDFDSAVIKSYDKAAFVGTDAPEAGHMQGELIGDYLLKDYNKYDINGDGVISYVMFKGQEGNPEADARTQYAVEDANKKLTAAGKSELKFYDNANVKKYLVDQNGKWSAEAATSYMQTILAEYSEANGNMVELVIANNDAMAMGAVSALQAAGYNKGTTGSKTIPVFGVDALDAAVQMVNDGKMAGTIKQDADGMASTIMQLVTNVVSGSALMTGTENMNVDTDAAKIRVPYQKITADMASGTSSSATDSASSTSSSMSTTSSTSSGVSAASSVSSSMSSSTTSGMSASKAQ